MNRDTNKIINFVENHWILEKNSRERSSRSWLRIYAQIWKNLNLTKWIRQILKQFGGQYFDFVPFVEFKVNSK